MLRTLNLNIQFRMSAGTVSTGSSNIRSDSQSGTGRIMDQSIHVYNLPEKERINVCYWLDQSNVWEKTAQLMGYGISDLVVGKMWC